MEIRRTHDGRPYIVDEVNGEEIPYTRTSKLSSALDDGYGLDLWHQRMVAVGLATNQWLLPDILDNQTDAKELNALCEVARNKAGESEKSAWGTVIHWFTECIDNELEWTLLDPPDDVKFASSQLGRSIADIYVEAADDLDAYEFATQEISTVMAEVFVVQDEVKAAGTLDRIYNFRGKNYVGDLKTGRVDLSALKFSMQMATYARSQLYEPPEDPSKLDQSWESRKPLPDVDLERALLIHLPMKQGICNIYWSDIGKGWEAVKMAVQLRELRRKGRGYLRDVNLPDPVAVPPLPEDVKTIAQLREFAGTYNIPLKGKTKKDDIRVLITEAEGEIFE